jgi:uncharacterized membrane protein YhaH (DUF805 family)
MTLHLSDLYRLDGTVSRSTYLTLGTVLMLIKYGLDWIVATWIFGVEWNPFNYLVVPGGASGITQVPAEERWLHTSLLLIALPFIWLGVVLTVRRLRTTGLPLGLVVLFFVPVVNLVFFLVLGALSAHPEWARHPHPERFPRLRALHARVARENPVARGAFALLVTVPVGLGLTILSATYLGAYGWALFVGLPFVVGMGSVLVYGFGQPQSTGSCLLVSFLSIVVLGVLGLAVAIEGAICLIMAAPIAIVVGMLGGAIGCAIQYRPWSLEETPYLLPFLFLLVPSLMAAEFAADPQAALIAVSTAVEVEAPPQRVWDRVVSFPELPEPHEWLFRAGVAYPTRAEIHGRGPGAVRHCVFSTGTFVEPIEVWDEPHLLRFAVTEQPDPMREWSPYDIHPPHLDHYLVSQRGQFLLTELPGGRTRLEGTTWYTNKMWPEWYWQMWSDAIIHRIHNRVLVHIKKLAEE